MKKITAIILAGILFLGAAALADEPDGYVATGGRIIDQQAYPGPWQQAYLQILNSHSGLIHAYQERQLDYYIGDQLIKVPCKPVGLTDITGDSIPELIFIEAANPERGDLYLYSADGTKAECVLYIPGITRLGYEDVGMGFDIYLSSADGGTLVAEYDEYEWPWILQLKRDAFGRYSLLSWLRAEYDNSGEEEDRYYQNGAKVSYDTYNAAHQQMRNGRTVTLSTYTTNDASHYGFTMTWEEAVQLLGGSPAAPAAAPRPAEVYGLTIAKLATRKGPGTQYDGGGTYSVKNQYIKVLAKAWDKRNGIWWVKCEIPYHGEIRILWTGWKRFDHSTISLDDLPEEVW